MLFAIIYGCVMINRSNIILRDRMDYKLKIVGGSCLALFQYSGCGLKELGEKPGCLSIGVCGDQNMKCMLTIIPRLSVDD
jgi:hypothetical protein